MIYEFARSNIFSHRVRMEPGIDDSAILDLFIRDREHHSRVIAWLKENVGPGSYYASGGKWHAYWQNRGRSNTPAFDKGPFHVGFRDRQDALMFQLAW